VSRGSAYDSFGEELSSIASSPDIHEHIRVLTMIARRIGGRLAENDSRNFRESVRDLAQEADRHLSGLMRAELDGRREDFSRHGPKLSKAFQELSRLCEEGLAGIDAELEFSKVVTDLLKRVESYESLKSSRINALSTAAVGKMIQQFEAILRKYLQPERAQSAYAELMSMYPRNAPSPPSVPDQTPLPGED